jgi:hypothetical protein
MGHRTRRSAPESETVIGVLIPHGWDEHFSVTSISLACDGEREIVINNLDAHPGLLVLLRKRISATGTMERDEQGESMAVRSYRPLKESDGNEFGSKGTTHENSL